MRGGTGRWVIAAACATLVGLSAPPASATVAGCGQLTRHPRITAQPPAQQRYDLDRLAPLATGRTVVVAVIDSGVDGDHPQLRGRVAKGRDFLHGRSDALQDCTAHGTAVAGIIAAGPADGVAFRGLAPDVEILPVRVTDRKEGDPPPSDPQAEVRSFARAIHWAVEQDADVINLSLTLDQDHDVVHDAIRRAVRAGIVVVAAAGNGGAAQKGNPTPYPAAYPDVLGVGAVDDTGTRGGFSQRGPYVDVMAPGYQVVMTAAGGGHLVDSGTSFATPFVSGTAALIMQRFPKLRGRDVIDRIIATADPAPGGRRSDEYGYGIVNPYRALTETVVPPNGARPAAAPLPTADPAVAAMQHRRAQTRATALRLAAVGLGMTAVVVLIAVVVPRGRHRRWSPAGRG
jgi:type VII secretion-associated serine protease mycosin